MEDAKQARQKRRIIMLQKRAETRQASIPFELPSIPNTSTTGITNHSSPPPNRVKEFNVFNEDARYFPAKIFTTKNGTPSKQLPIIIADNSQKEISCILWGEFAEEFEQFLATSKAEITTIAFQLARLKTFQGEMQITNSFNATKMWINPAIPQVQELLNSLPTSSIETMTPTLSQRSASKIPQIKDDIDAGNTSYTLNDIKNAAQCGYYMTLATIEKIETSNNWYYDSCPKCAKKAQEDMNQKKCSECGTIYQKVLPRFKVQVLVSDHTGVASFIIFDNEAIPLLGKTAQQLRHELIKEGCPDSFPDELECLLNRRFIFKIQISDYNVNQGGQTYAVKKMSDDIKLIQQLQNSSTLSQSWQDTTTQSHSVENQNIHDNKYHPEASDTNSFCQESNQETSSNTAGCSTPIPGKLKGLMDEIDDASLEDILTPQLSTCRPKKHIKIEKTD